MSKVIPTNAATFLECFPLWPDDSLFTRKDIEAGSRWTLRDLGTFQILRPKQGRIFPGWLQDHYPEAEKRVKGSTEIQQAITLLDNSWRGLNRADLFRASGTFAPFFSLLAEVTEQPPTPTPNRILREPQWITQNAQPSSQESSSSSDIPSSPLGPVAKRPREDRSQSYQPPNYSGDESDQSQYDRRVKSEPVTNASVYHFLECVTENARQVEDIGPRLEWALTQDTFHVRTLRSSFST